MTRTIVKRYINSPVDVVFSTVANISNFRQAIPDIVNVEFVSDIQSGVGTRFKETRNMNGRKATVELEVTEYLENNRVRLVSDAGGSIWDTVFTTETSGNATNLTMVMDAKPYRLLAKLTSPLIKGMIKKAIEKDMDAVKVYSEGLAEASQAN